MIRLTRLNHQALALNSDLIKWIESAPDTVITLVTGEKLVVLESCNEVIAAIAESHKLSRYVSAGQFRILTEAGE